MYDLDYFYTAQKRKTSDLNGKKIILDSYTGEQKDATSMDGNENYHLTE